MSINEFELQKYSLVESQKRHARELMISGIAQKALRRRFDDNYYADATTTDTPSESLPVVMFDGSNPDENYLYVYLLRDKEFVGTEVNIADIKNPGTPEEVVKPIEGFTVDEALIVKSLVDELVARKSTNLPNLSDDLLGITVA